MSEPVDAFVARLHHSTTLLDVGALDHPTLGRVRAARTFNAIYGQTWVWAFTGMRRRDKRPSFLENHTPTSAYRPEPEADDSASDS